MSLSAVVVDIHPDPIAIAQFFAERPGFAWLHTAAGSGWGASYVAVEPAESSDAPIPPPARGVKLPRETPAAARRAGSARSPTNTGAHSSAPAGCPTRPEVSRIGPGPGGPVTRRWSRSTTAATWCASSEMTRTRSPPSARELASARPRRRSPGPARLVALEDDDPPWAHVERVRQVQALIAAGDLYQVNLARRQRLAAYGSPLDLYLAMAARAPAPFGACLSDGGGTFVCATSPELFLHSDQGRLRTTPIKGTRPRGAHAEEDAKLARELDQSLKERAELTMILDVERNDLGRVSRAGCGTDVRRSHGRDAPHDRSPRRHVREHGSR